MTVMITNTQGWIEVDGRIAKPSFTLQKLRWRGDGEDVYLVGCDSTGSCEGTPGVDCINWDDAPEWALNALDEAGVSLEEEFDVVGFLQEIEELEELNDEPEAPIKADLDGSL